MSQRKTCLLLAGVLITATTVAFFDISTVYALGDEKVTKGPCSTNPFRFREVERACKAGGRTKAGAFMEATVNKARKQGLKIDDSKIECKSCHVNLTAYKLLTNAVDDLRTLLEQ